MQSNIAYKKRLLAILTSLTLVFTMSFSTITTFAAEEDLNVAVENEQQADELSPADVVAGDEEDGVVKALGDGDGDDPIDEEAAVLSGGETITEDGEFTLADDASGIITINGGLDVTIYGGNYDESTDSFINPYTALSFVVGDEAALTIEDLYVSAPSATDSPSIIDFTGTGTLNISGHNLLDRPAGYVNAAMIHVGKDADVAFDGDGILWGYKESAGSFIGSNINEVCGNITFNGGTWLLKVNKTGALIGQDSPAAATGEIVINDGVLYLKSISYASILGSSRQGQAPNVTINGGQLELYTDWKGAAIGGSDMSAGAGTFSVNGGSIRTISGQNAYSTWGVDANSNKGAVLTDANITADHDTAMLAFDATQYAEDDIISVYVDDSEDPFYEGGLYEFCTNEIKSPSTPYAIGTMCNWLPNTSEYALNEESEYNGAYPVNNGSQLAGDNTLVFQLSKEDHVLTVNGDQYNADYDEDTNSFILTAIEDSVLEVSDAADLKAIANTVNGGNNLEGVDVILTEDIDLSDEAWTPIGSASNAFAGTFDGDGHTISGLTIAGGTGGYKALFGNNSGTVKDFTLEGQYGSEESKLSAGGDCYAGAVAYNTGTVEGVVADVDMYFTAPENTDTYAVGGVVGRNAGGTVTNCGNDGPIICDPAKSFYRVGGIVGHMQNNGTISECYNKATVQAFNYRNGCQGVGGILGSLDSNGTVSYCYNTGEVFNGYGDGSTGGKQGAGGIVGAINAGSVDHCYAVGNTHAPGSSGIIIGKLGNGTYSNLYSLNTARAYNSFGSKTDTEHSWGGYSNIKYHDGSDENADGSLKYQGAALANDYNSGYTIKDSFTKSADEMMDPAFVNDLNGEDGDAFQESCGEFPVLSWEEAVAHVPGEEAVETPTVPASYSDGEYHYTIHNCANCGFGIESTRSEKIYTSEKSLKTLAEEAIEEANSKLTEAANLATAAQGATGEEAVDAALAALNAATAAQTAAAAAQAAAATAQEAAALEGNEAATEAAELVDQAAAAAGNAETAISDANTLVDNATQAAGDIRTAKETAKAKVDTLVNSLNTALYTTDSLTAFTEAVNAFNEVYNSTKATQQEVIAASEAVTTAYDGLTVKAANKLTVKTKKATIKAKKLKKKARTIKRAKVLTVSNATGAVTYAKVSGSKKLTVDKAGNIKIKKKTKKGTYKVVVKVTAAGDGNTAAATKTVQVKVKVKK